MTSTPTLTTTITIGAFTANINSESVTNKANRTISFIYDIDQSIIDAIVDVSNGKVIQLSTNDELITNGNMFAEWNANHVANPGIYSHFGSYAVIKLCGLIGIRQSMIENAFSEWTANPKWVKMRSVEYLWLQWKLLPCSVDWKLFFRTHPYPYTALIAALEISEVQSVAQLCLDIVAFFESYVLTRIFDQSNDETKARLTTLETQREQIADYFLINPHDSKFNKINGVEPEPTEGIWSCAKISKAKRRNPALPAYVDLREFQRRFDEFTCGMFKKSPNPDIPEGSPFPWKGVAVAGGSALQMLEQEYNPQMSSDCDLFVYGPTHQKNTQTLNNIINWFASPTTYFGLRGSVVYIYIVDCKRVFQVICANSKNLYSVIGRFDTSQIQWLYADATIDPKDIVFRDYELDNPLIANIQPRYAGMTVFGTHHAFKTIKNRTAVITNITNHKTERLIKTMMRGYNLVADKDFAEKHVDIDALIKNKNNPIVNDIINTQAAFFYPSSEFAAMMQPEDRTRWIMGMIRMHSKATTVTQNPADIKNQVVINGNFDTDYDAMSFANFQVNNVRFLGGRRNFDTAVKSISGSIHLLSAYNTVDSVVHGENSIEITFKVTDENFIRFINEVVSINMLRIYTQQDLTKKILSPNNTFTVEIPRAKITYMATKQIGVLKGSNGRGLNIDEDLKQGDSVRMIFGMNVNIAQDRREITLSADKLIKDVTNEAEQTEETIEQNENEIAKIEQTDKKIEQVQNEIVLD